VTSPSATTSRQPDDAASRYRDVLLEHGAHPQDALVAEAYARLTLTPSAITARIDRFVAGAAAEVTS